MNCHFFLYRVLTPPLTRPNVRCRLTLRIKNRGHGQRLPDVHQWDQFLDPTNRGGEDGETSASHKYAFKSILRYKIGVSIIGGDLVWIQGPYPVGRFTDIVIFNKVFRYFLKPGERVEADNGYVGAANKIQCPDNPCNPEKNEGMQSRARYCHKTINGRFKTWGILQNAYHHDIRRHGKVFWTIAVITQLETSNGSPLFSVEYED